MIRERDRVANDSLRRGRLDLESDRPLIQAQWRHPARNRCPVLLPSVPACSAKAHGRFHGVSG